MRRIRAGNTAPEMTVRRLLHREGYRYRLHRKDLPGKPDLVFPARGKAVFIHGCFWHRHSTCRDGHLPKTRLDYWIPKLTANVNRDRQHRRNLARLGWQTITVWECQIASHPEKVLNRLKTFLDS